jgi:oligo-1,6-glucosidase
MAHFSRDNARTPMQWDSGSGAGFTTGEPWLAVNPNHSWLNAAAQADDGDSVFAHYRALIGLRHELAVLVDGDFTPLWEEDPRIWAYVRSTAEAALLVVANCGRDRRTVDVGPDWSAAELVLGNLAGTPATIESTALDLGGWDARVYVKRRESYPDQVR